MSKDIARLMEWNDLGNKLKETTGMSELDTQKSSILHQLQWVYLLHDLREERDRAALLL